MILRSQAVRFLNQATFGASEESIVELQNAGSFERWIDQQIAAPVSLTEPFVRANSNGSLRTTRHEIWWRNALTGPDQLRQRMALALSEIFVVSDLDYILSNSQYGMCNFYDMLATQSFGNFRDVLGRVTLHPVMGVYLSMVRNEKADPARNVRPDENFAREVLQLFTIGLNELGVDGRPVIGSDGKPLPSYGQSTIEEFAKVFTGWDHHDSRAWDSNQGHDLTAPMVANEQFHDVSAKILLDGVMLPAGQTAAQDLEGALDNIFAHANVAPFVATALIKRFVTSNPEPAYVERVAGALIDNGSGVRGDLNAVIKAILLDEEARRDRGADDGVFGKVKEPMIRISQLWRAFAAVPGPQADGVYRTQVRTLDRVEEVVGQSPMKSPSVFNFFLPDHPLGEESALVAPEAQILSEVNIASTNNMFFAQIGSNNRNNPAASQTVITIDLQVALADDAQVLVDHLDELLMAGTLPAEYSAEIVESISTLPTDDEGRKDRVTEALYLIINSPYHYIQK